MKLFRVELTMTTEAIIFAEDEAAALATAKDNLSDIVEQGLDHGTSDSFEVRELNQGHKLPPGWGQDCIPFGEDDRTIAQLWDAEDWVEVREGRAHCKVCDREVSVKPGSAHDCPGGK